MSSRNHIKHTDFNTDNTSVPKLRSSFPLLKTYTGERNLPFPNIFDWIEVKRRDDKIGNLWRVHDKLYNLKNFISKHPGGPDWLEVTRGTDITEAFEASHVVNVKSVEIILEKYYVSNAKLQRNSPYTFKENGFYKTLKRKIEPVLKEVGTDSTPELLNLQDGLVAAYFTLAVLGVWVNLIWLQILAGILLGMCVTGGHNFFHKKDNWRRFYFDLGPMSSYEWRISHGISHHLYPNTILDYEVMMGEPFVEMLPVSTKNWFIRYPAMLYAHVLYALFGHSEILKRILSLYHGKQKLRPENLIIFAELVLFMFIAPSVWAAVRSWMIIIMACTYMFTAASNNAAHHHPTCFHDGDETRIEPDFGLCQLDATKAKSDWYHQNMLSVLTTFGEHPLHHLFPTICHSKLKFIKPILFETLREFSEEYPWMTQWDLLIGTHLQMARIKPNRLPKRVKASGK